jgi:guanylate kinase
MVPSKIIVVTAPSGSGKTTLVKRLLAACPGLAFSVSACTRRPRPNEVDGRDYYFLDETKFQKLIQQDAFVEWEMVYPGKYYGTLKTEIGRIWESGCYPLVDIDVKGALAIQEAFPEQALTIFIQAPSLEELRQRLHKRGTETPQSLEERVGKAAFEVTFAPQFDCTIINDDVEVATKELVQVVEAFLLPSAAVPPGTTF